MTEQRTTEFQAPDTNGHTTTTIITDQPRSGGALRWLGLLVLLAIVVAAFVLFSRMSDAEIASENAVADAAEEVGDAASQVGQAAQDAGEAAQDALEDAGQ